jgi:hypothetical protein
MLSVATNASRTVPLLLFVLSVATKRRSMLLSNGGSTVECVTLRMCLPKCCSAMDVRSGFQLSYHNIIWHYVVWAPLSKPQNKHSKQPVKPIRVWNDSSTITKVKILTENSVFVSISSFFFFKLLILRLFQIVNFKLMPIKLLRNRNTSPERERKLSLRHRVRTMGPRILLTTGYRRLFLSLRGIVLN